MDENTQFNLTGDHKFGGFRVTGIFMNICTIQPSFRKLMRLSKRNHPNLAQTYIPENAVNTPVTMKTEDGLYLSFHEANLTDYAGMTLKVDNENLAMQSELVGSDRLGEKVKVSLPF